jgi:hypothetical protein
MKHIEKRRGKYVYSPKRSGEAGVLLMLLFKCVAQHAFNGTLNIGRIDDELGVVTLADLLE